MEDFSAVSKRQHKITLVNRKNATLSGIVDVLSFDLLEILLETDQGMLMIKGKDMHVTRLSLEKGELDIDGQIDSLTYSETRSFSEKGESLLTKLFK